jgi:hypothetical protein
VGIEGIEVAIRADDVPSVRTVGYGIGWAFIIVERAQVETGDCRGRMGGIVRGDRCGGGGRDESVVRIDSEIAKIIVVGDVTVGIGGCIGSLTEDLEVVGHSEAGA